MTAEQPTPAQLAEQKKHPTARVVIWAPDRYVPIGVIEK